MKDIEYEKDGVRKFAQERFREELEAVGWVVVDKPKRGRPKKEESDDE